MVTTESGRDLSYDVLVVTAGIETQTNRIKGLSEALADPKSGVSTIYSYSACDKTWDDIEGLRSGKAVFTQPAGVIKCAGGMLVTSIFIYFRLKKFRSTPKDHVDGLGQVPAHKPR